MTKKEKISELNSVALMMSAHPENNKDSEFNDRLNGLCRVIESMQKELNEERTREVQNKVLKKLKAPKWIYPALDMLPRKSCELLCQFKDDGRYEKMDYEDCGEDSANLTEYVERFIYL